ncbi:MAG: hypothetical protein AAGA53_02860 [Pseudomonadota bacterium]
MCKPDFKFVMACLFFLAATVSSAHSNGCKLVGVELDCGGGNDISILDALAAPETADVLANPLADLNKFESPNDLEKFRKSIDANWKSAARVELKQRRKMLQRKISAAEFEEWSNVYRFARNNYSAALTYYRTLIWHGKTGKAAPKD